MAVCAIGNCGKEVAARGWCDTHWRRHGDPRWVSGRRPAGTGGLDRKGYIRLCAGAGMLFEHRATPTLYERLVSAVDQEIFRKPKEGE